MTAIADWVDEETMAAQLDGVPWTRPHAIAINGMGSQGNDIGFATDSVVQLDPEVWAHEIIDYTAAAFPMGTSVLEGIEKVVAAVQAVVGRKVSLWGYSEGAMVIDHVWVDECMNPVGRLHDRYLAGDIIFVGLYGDPMRCPGIARGNELAGFPVPADVDGVATGGISGTLDLTPEQTTLIVFSCTNDGDVYGAAPVGDSPQTAISGVGHDMEIIFNIVQKFDSQNVFGILVECLDALGIESGISVYSLIGLMEGAVEGIIDNLRHVPITGATQAAHVAYMVQAIMTFGAFVLKGLGPHGDYEKMVPAMVAKANEIGRQYATI